MTLTFVLVARGAKQILGLQAPIEVCCSSILEVKLTQNKKTEIRRIAGEIMVFNSINTNERIEPHIILCEQLGIRV